MGSSSAIGDVARGLAAGGVVCGTLKRDTAGGRGLWERLSAAGHTEVLTWQTNREGG